MGAPTKSTEEEEENLDTSSNSSGDISVYNGKPKTVYLIRHAESDENRRRDSLTRCFERLSTGVIPSSKDVNASFELLNVPAQLNSDVSDIGAKQIKHMGELLRQQKFLEKMGVQLVVHSPLLRARQTCEGLLGCQANPMKKPESVARVEELEFLIERQPQEVPQDVILKDVAPTQSSFTRRIKHFERWLAKQPEDVVAVVGHSLHFKTMLNVDFKFKNCEVWVAEFDPSRCCKDDQTSPPNSEGSTGDESATLSNSNNKQSLGGRLTTPWTGLKLTPPDLMMMSSVRRQRQAASSPWSELKRVYGCDLNQQQEEESSS